LTVFSLIYVVGLDFAVRPTWWTKGTTCSSIDER